MPPTMTMDVSDAEHHWEELVRRVSDISVQTVHDHEHEHCGKSLALATKSTELLPDELVVLEGQLSPISATSSTKDELVTAYEDVNYRGEVGTLVLSRQRLVFCSHDEQGELPVHPRVQPDHVWKWKDVVKQRISPAKSGKITLRLALKNNKEDNVAFGFSSREELDRASKDVSKRLRISKQQPTMTPMKKPTVLTSSPDGTAETMDSMSTDTGELEMELEEETTSTKSVQVVQPTEATALLTKNSSEVSQEANTILGYDRNIVLAVVGVLVVTLVAILFFVLSSSATSTAVGARMLGAADQVQGGEMDEVYNIRKNLRSSHQLAERL